MREDNWPLLTVERSVFDPSKMENEALDEEEDQDEIDNKKSNNDWDVSGDENDDDMDDGGDDLGLGDGDLDDIDVTGGAWGDDGDSDLDLDDDLEDMDDDSKVDSKRHDGSSNDNGVFVAPSADKPYSEYWSSSNLAVDHICAGDFDSAMDLLSRQIGIVNFEPMKPYFVNSHLAVRPELPGLPSTPSMRNNFLLRDNLEATIRSPKDTAPRPLYTLSYLVSRLKEAYKKFQKGLFDDATEIFQDILMAVPLVVVKDRDESSEIKELVGFCKEYLTYLKIFSARKKIGKSDPKRSVELAAYGTNCALQPPHLVLALMVAMTQAYKLKNFITAASFARRLLEVSERFSSSKSSKSMSSAAKKAEKVLKLSERQGRNSVEIEYDETDTYVLCCKTMTPIYKGTKKTRCPYCFAHYLPDHADSVCEICGVAQVGLETLGLVSFSSSSRRR